MGLSIPQRMRALLVLHWLSFLVRVIVILLCLCLCSCSGFPHNAVMSGNETDRLALLAFKAEVTIDGGALAPALSLWNESIHFCRWIGVTCGRRHHQRVVALDLAHRQLTGPISPHIGNMSFLRVLSLANNSFIHIIPPEIGRLRRLRYLALNNNSISGEIPANISGCANLIHLSLSRYELEGNIPGEVGFLSKLEVMYIGRNNLTGRVPHSLGNLSSLQEFYAFENHISGTIPDALGQLTNLEELGLAVNSLFGTIPPSVINLSSIAVFDVGDNQIQGSLPSDLGNTLSAAIRFFTISTNLFTGSIPVSISNASKLEILQFQRNILTGKVPTLEKLHNLQRFLVYGNHLGFGESEDLSFLSSLTNATNLSILSLSQNNFGGLLPEFISNFSANLVILGMDDNRIFGSIPTEIGNLVNLETLGLSSNQLAGYIPISIGKLQKLQTLQISVNKFSGNIPFSLGNLTLLSGLDLGENRFHGSIPSSLGKCQNLGAIRLAQNNLQGIIPPEFISLSTLFSLDLSRNHLTGSFPMEVGKLKNIEELVVFDNMLSGEIPSTLGSCITLRILSLAGNNFHGILPSSLSYLRGIEELDLSGNNLSGKIPNYLEGFVFLHYLNLSFNDFEGLVPKTGVFRNATAVSLKGNNKLCGGILELQLPSCNSQGSKKKISSLTLKLIIPIACGLLGLLLVFCFRVLPWFRKTCEVPSLRILGNPFMKVSYQSLLKATDGFSTANLIGVGNFGSVYKGILDQGEKIVAVKVLNFQFHGASKSFQAECEVLRSIKHRNLVKVLTTCSSIDYQGNDFKALVYEFMDYGSLEKWLHPDENEGESHKSRNLNLLERLNIAIDVASALDYLHHYCPKPIAHCDLKPSNVLLDEEMTAHVGDFGLARFLPQATYDSAANQSSSVGLRGSVGYAAPEYGTGNEVSTSGDVYSYGILLLEMFTGKRPTDNMFSDGLNLHNFAKMALPEDVAQIADPKLLQRREEEEEASSSISVTGSQSHARGHKIQECLISLLRVGIACSEELPRDRMDIKDVLTQLLRIKNNLGIGQAHISRGARTTIQP